MITDRRPVYDTTDLGSLVEGDLVEFFPDLKGNLPSFGLVRRRLEPLTQRFLVKGKRGAGPSIMHVSYQCLRGDKEFGTIHIIEPERVRIIPIDPKTEASAYRKAVADLATTKYI